MAGNTRNISVRAIGDFSNLSQGLRTAQNEIQSFGDRVKAKFKEIGEIGRGLRDVFEVFKVVGESVGELAVRAAELDGGMSSLNRTLGSSAVGYMAWANSTAKSFGISKMSAIEYGKSIAMLLGDVYKDQGQLAKATEQIMQGGAVVAAKTGKSQQEVYEELNSALMGHAAAVKSLDINIMENALVHSEAYKQIAHGAPWTKLSIEQQQYIRVTELNRQIQQKFGDTIGDGMDARLMLFRASLDNLKTSLSEAFMPILYKVLPILTTFMNWIGTAINYVAAFFQVLFGYSGIHAGMGASVNKHAQAVDALGNSYANAGNKASAAHKKIAGGSKKSKLNKNGTASFDQVHTLTTNSNATSGSGAVGAGGATGGLGDIGSAMGDIGTKANGLSDNLEQIRQKVQGFAEKVREAFQSVKDFFGDVGGFIKAHADIIIASLAGITAGYGAFILITKSGEVVSRAIEGISAAINVLEAGIAFLLSPIGLVVAAVALLTAGFVYFYRTNEGFRDFVNNILTKIKDVASDLWKNVMIPFGKFLAGVFVDSWNAVKTSGEWLWKNVLVPLGNYLKTFYDQALVPLGKILKDVLKVAFDTLSTVAKSFWKNVMVPLGDFFKTNFKPAVEAISTVLKFLWNNVMAPYAKFLGETFIVIFKTLDTVIGTLWETTLKPFATWMGGVFADTFKTVFEGAKGLIDGFSKATHGLLSFITDVFKGKWKSAWGDIGEAVSGVFDGLWAVVKTPLNLIIDGVNALINGLNHLSIKVPDWVPKGLGGGQTWGVSIPNIPHLATGGIITSPTIAQIGEAGPEMVVPLQNTSFVDKLAGALGTAVMSAMQFSNNNNNNNKSGDIILKIDGRQFARVIKPYTDLEQKRVGTNLRLQTL